MSFDAWSMRQRVRNTDCWAAGSCWPLSSAIGPCMPARFGQFASYLKLSFVSCKLNGRGRCLLHCMLATPSCADNLSQSCWGHASMYAMCARHVCHVPCMCGHMPETNVCMMHLHRLELVDVPGSLAKSSMRCNSSSSGTQLLNLKGGHSKIRYHARVDQQAVGHVVKRDEPSDEIHRPSDHLVTLQVSKVPWLGALTDT